MLQYKKKCGDLENELRLMREDANESRFAVSDLINLLGYRKFTVLKYYCNENVSDIINNIQNLINVTPYLINSFPKQRASYTHG